MKKMGRTHKKLFFTVFSLILLFMAPAFAGIKIGGSSTVTNFVFFENQDKLQQKTGYDFEVFTSSSGRGVIALVEGMIDIGMISSELPTLIEALNKKGHYLKIEDFNIHPVNQTKVIFVVGENNPMEGIRYDQMQKIMWGEIQNWDELGFDLGDIKIVTEHETGGIYNTLVKKGLDGRDIRPDKIMMQNGPQVSTVVAQMPNAFGMLSDTTSKEQRKGIKVIKEEDFNPIIQNMSFITLKTDERPEIKDFITKLLSPTIPKENLDKKEE